MTAAALLVALAATVGSGWWMVRPHRTIVGESPSDLAATSVRIQAPQGRTLAGWFVRGKPGSGALLLMHGIRSDRRQMAAVARILAREHFTLLLFDFQAEGESEGNRISAGFRESEDARAALEYLRREAPGEKVGAIGRSMGGAAALLGAGPLALDALVLESVYPTIEQAITSRIRFHLGPLGWLGGPLSPLLVWQLPLWLGIGPEQLHPVDAISRLHTPVLVMIGDSDRYLPVGDGRALFDTAPVPKELWIVPGADHDRLMAAQPVDYERRVVSFLRRWLR